MERNNKFRLFGKSEEVRGIAVKWNSNKTAVIRTADLYKENFM